MTADDNPMPADQLIADYLQRLRAAAGTLPADRRDELIEEITAHIAEARAEGPAATTDPLAVRSILDRLGDPTEIVRTAAEADQGLAAGPAGSGGSGGVSAGGAWTYPMAAPSAGRPAKAGGLEITTVVFLLIGGVVIPVLGWIVGVVLLWISPRWRTRDKLIGTLVWPGGLLAPIMLFIVGGAAVLTTAASSFCPASGEVTGTTTTGVHLVRQMSSSCAVPDGPPAWLVISIGAVLLAASIAGPVYTAVRLLRRAQADPAQSAAEPADLLPV